jgi:hypothetical protein
LNRVSLERIDAGVHGCYGDCFVSHEFRHRADVHESGEAHDAGDDFTVHRTVGEVADEAAIDLQIVDRESLQVIEGGEARAEVVEGYRDQRCRALH